MCRTYKEGVLA